MELGNLVAEMKILIGKHALGAELTTDEKARGFWILEKLADSTTEKCPLCNKEKRLAYVVEGFSLCCMHIKKVLNNRKE